MQTEPLAPTPFLSPLTHVLRSFLPVAADVAVPRVKPGDQAPATASAEAAEGGEEEQGAGQHRRHSGSRGNENKGSGTHCGSRVGRFPPRSTNYKGIIHTESKLISPLSQPWQNVLFLISLNHHAKPIFSLPTLPELDRCRDCVTPLCSCSYLSYQIEAPPRFSSWTLLCLNESAEDFPIRTINVKLVYIVYPPPPPKSIYINKYSVEKKSNHNSQKMHLR